MGARTMMVKLAPRLATILCLSHVRLARVFCLLRTYLWLGNCNPGQYEARKAAARCIRTLAMPIGDAESAIVLWRVRLLSWESGRLVRRVSGEARPAWGSGCARAYKRKGAPRRQSEFLDTCSCGRRVRQADGFPRTVVCRACCCCCWIIWRPLSSTPSLGKRWHRTGKAR